MHVLQRNLDMNRLAVSLPRPMPQLTASVASMFLGPTLCDLIAKGRGGTRVWCLASKT